MSQDLLRLSLLASSLLGHGCRLAHCSAPSPDPLRSDSLLRRFRAQLAACSCFSYEVSVFRLLVSAPLPLVVSFKGLTVRGCGPRSCDSLSIIELVICRSASDYCVHSRARFFFCKSPLSRCVFPLVPPCCYPLFGSYRSTRIGFPYGHPPIFYLPPLTWFCPLPVLIASWRFRLHRSIRPTIIPLRSS